MTADTVGGVWSYALELSSALAERGVTVGLATLGEPPGPGQRADALSIPRLRLFASHFRCEWMEDPWEDVARAGTWLVELEEGFRPDVVHLNSYSHGVQPFRAPVLTVGHSCVLSWWRAVREETAPAAWDRYRRSVARGIGGADRVVTPTHAMLQMLRRHYGALPPSRVIPNGRCGQAFRPRPKQDLVLACGRFWDEGKNLSALEHAAPHISWPVEVAGSLKHPNGGEREGNNVRCVGELPSREVAERMGRAAICAHPARYEPFGLVPLEAALSGCSLVLGDISSLRENWEGAALFVDPDDPLRLAEAVERLVTSETLRTELAVRARERAGELTPGAMAEGYLSLYRRMTRHSPSATTHLESGRAGAGV